MTTFNYKGEPIIPTRGMEDALTKIISALEVDYRGIGFHSLTRFGKVPSRSSSAQTLNGQNANTWPSRQTSGCLVLESPHSWTGSFHSSAHK